MWAAEHKLVVMGQKAPWIGPPPRIPQSSAAASVDRARSRRRLPGLLLRCQSPVCSVLLHLTVQYALFRGAVVLAGGGRGNGVQFGYGISSPRDLKREERMSRRVLLQDIRTCEASRFAARCFSLVGFV